VLSRKALQRYVYFLNIQTKEAFFLKK